MNGTQRFLLGTIMVLAFAFLVYAGVTNYDVIELSGTAADPSEAGRAQYGGTSIVFEGATANAFETTVSVTDPTADRTVTLPDAGGVLTLAAAAPDAADAVSFGASTIIFEGATADAFETTLTVVDPTADRTITFPDLTGTVILSTAAVQAANAIWGAANALNFEGATADAFEGTLSAGDFTADVTYVLEAAGGLTIPGTRSASLAAAGASYGYDGVMFEGATADGFETILAVTDPTADSTTTIGAAGGWTFPAAGTFSGDVTVTDADGFAGATGGAHSQLSGITSVAMDYVVGTAGRTEAQTVRSDGETAAAWDEVTCAGGANTCVAVPSTDDTTNEKFGATAQSITIGTMVATDTFGMAVFGAEDFDALENVGIWMQADSTTLGTDWQFQIVDDGGTRSFPMEAITVANQWQFVEVDLTAGSTCGGGDCDVSTRFLIECNHATNCNGITFKIDNFYIWDTADETALNFDILDQPGAVGSVWSFVTADAGAQSHARTRMIHCDTIAGSGTDFVIDPDDNTIISVDDNSTLTLHMLYHRADY